MRYRHDAGNTMQDGMALDTQIAGQLIAGRLAPKSLQEAPPHACQTR